MLYSKFTMKLTKDEFYQICVNQKIKVTPQRWVTYQALILMEGHPRVEDVYNKVIKKFPSITLSTVYKTLEWLEKKKFISSIFLRDPPKIYDTTTDARNITTTYTYDGNGNPQTTKNSQPSCSQL